MPIILDPNSSKILLCFTTVRLVKFKILPSSQSLLCQTQWSLKLLHLLLVDPTAADQLATAKDSKYLAPREHTRDLPSRHQPIPLYQGRTNPALSKPCLCLSDTRHFHHFRRFRGGLRSEYCFQWVECKFVIFAVFVKTAPFWHGTTTRVTKNTVCANPIIWAASIRHLM